MTTFSDLEQQNPNIREQYDEWRDMRTQNGEDPNDWDSFRQHVMALGAPDPGDRPGIDEGLAAADTDPASTPEDGTDPSNEA